MAMKVSQPSSTIGYVSFHHATDCGMFDAGCLRNCQRTVHDLHLVFLVIPDYSIHCSLPYMITGVYIHIYLYSHITYKVVSNIFFCSPLCGEDSQFEKYFSKGLKPPSRYYMMYIYIYISPPMFKRNAAMLQKTSDQIRAPVLQQQQATALRCRKWWEATAKMECPKNLDVAPFELHIFIYVCIYIYMYTYLHK